MIGIIIVADFPEYWEVVLNDLDASPELV